MAQYLIEILGDKLDLSNIKADESGWLPSPETLKGKILVKVKSQFKMWLILFGERSQSSSNYLSSQFQDLDFDLHSANFKGWLKSCVWEK